jgi:hypothetical protein
MTSYTQNFSTLPGTSPGYAYTAAAQSGEMYGGAGGNTDLGSYALAGPNNAFDLSGINTGGSGRSIDGTSAMQGWYAITHASGSTEYYGTDAGSFTAGGIYNFGIAGSSARSLGAISTNASADVDFGVLLENNTSNTYSAFNLSYVAQLWHQDPNVSNLAFGYGVYASDTAIPRYQSDSGLSPTGFDAGTNLGEQSSGPIATQNISGRQNLTTAWAPGTYLWLTFDKNSFANTSQGTAIANLTFTPSFINNDTWSNNTGNNLWDASTSNNWTINGNVGSYTDGDNVVFAGGGMNSGVGTVIIAANGLNPGSVTFSNNTGTYKLFNAAGATAGIGSTYDQTTGTLTMNGLGTLDLTGLTLANDIGGVYLNAGTVLVSNGSTQFGNGSEVYFNGGTLRTTASTTLPNLDMVGGGTIDTDGNTETMGFGFYDVGVLNIIGGGTLSAAETTDSPVNCTIAPNTTLVLSAATSSTVLLAAESNGLDFEGNIILKNGIQLTLNGGSFSGGGSIGLNGSNAYLSSAGTVSSIGNAIVVNGPGYFNPASVSEGYSPDSFVTNLGATSGNELIIAGGLSGGAGTVALTGINFQANPNAGGSGTIVISSQMNYAGSTQINMTGGVLQLAVPHALPAGSDLVVGSNRNNVFGTPILDLDGNNQEFASIQNVGYGGHAYGSAYLTISNSSTNAATLTISGSTVVNNSFMGVIQDGTGTLNFVRSGTGDTVLGRFNNGVGTYSYTGVTNVLGGELQLENVSLSGGGAVTVSGGASFGGIGSIAGPLSIGNATLFEGQLPDGVQAGSITVNNSVSLQASSTFEVQVAQPSSGNAGYAGYDNDELLLTGGKNSIFSPNGATLDIAFLLGTFTKKSGLDYTYTIVDASAGALAPAQTFAGLLQGQIYTQGGFSYSLDYGQSQSGDIVLTVYSVPEPGSSLMIMGLLPLFTRRRRSAPTEKTI